MLLVLNVNNTNTVIALYPLSEQRTGELLATWRISTRHAQTADEYGILIRNLLETEGVDSKAISGIVIASVVPPIDWILRQFCERYFNHKPLFIEPGVKTGLPILTDHPGEVGADRVANCVGAFHLYKGPTIVVDFGTATNFDVVSRQGEFLGRRHRSGDECFRGSPFCARGEAAARGDQTASEGDWHKHGRQSADRTVLRPYRTGGWNSGTHDRGAWAGNEVRGHGGTGAADRR